MLSLKALLRRSAHSRTQTVVLGSVSLLAGQGVTVGSNLLVTAFLSRWLPAEQFGLWTVILSISALCVHLDFGMGQGLRNHLAALAASPGNAASGAARHAFLAVLATQVAIASALALLGIGAVLAGAPVLQGVGGAGAALPPSSPAVLALVVLLLAAGVPTNLGGWGLYAYQESHVRSAFDSARAVLLLAAALACARLVDFWALVAAYYLVAVVAGVLATAEFLRRRRWGFTFLVERPLAVVRRLGRNSFMFWVLGASTTLIATLTSLVASKVVGLGEAGNYRIAQQMFSLLTLVHFTVLTPLWSAYTQAAHAGDWAWLRRSFTRSRWMTVLIFGGGGAFFLVASPLVFRLWVGKNVASRSVIAWFGAWAFVTGWNNCYSVLLNGLSRIRRQAFWSVVAAVACGPVCLALGSWLGVQGILIGLIACSVPFLLSNVLEVRAALREHTSEEAHPSAAACD